MVAQAKITIDTRNGMMVQPSSSAMEPVIRRPDSFAGPVAVLDREDDDEHHDEQREERRHRRDEEIQVVHLGGEGGGLFGEERDTFQHKTLRSHARLSTGSAPADATRDAASTG